MKESDAGGPLELRFRGEREYEDLLSALIRERDVREYGAFLFALPDGSARLEVVDVEVLSGADFSAQSMDYLELRADALQAMIVRAHRTETALVEAHSHPFSEGPDVCFSRFDCRALSVAGPQISWRLPGRPYIALVFGRSSFDSLYWADRKRRPEGVVDICVGSTALSASGQSYTTWEDLSGPIR